MLFKLNMTPYLYRERGHSVALWLRHSVTNPKVAGSIPDEVIFLNLHNPTCRTMPWGCHPLTEMSTRHIKIMFLGSKVRRVRRADILTAICEPIF
jgi:hypothetical protein